MKEAEVPAQILKVQRRRRAAVRKRSRRCDIPLALFRYQWLAFLQPDEGRCDEVSAPPDEGRSYFPVRLHNESRKYLESPQREPDQYHRSVPQNPWRIEIAARRLGNY